MLRDFNNNMEVPYITQYISTAYDIPAMISIAYSSYRISSMLHMTYTVFRYKTIYTVIHNTFHWANLWRKSALDPVGDWPLNRTAPIIHLVILLFFSTRQNPR